MNHHWPGNIRELENEIQRAYALSGPVIQVEDLSREIVADRELLRPAGGGAELKDIVRMTANQKEREIILRTLEETGWKKSLAARKLGISRPTLDGRIRAFGLTPHFKRNREG
jgi:two-component system response regulator HydG